MITNQIKIQQNDSDQQTDDNVVNFKLFSISQMYSRTFFFFFYTYNKFIEKKDFMFTRRIKIHTNKNLNRRKKMFGSKQGSNNQ